MIIIINSDGSVKGLQDEDLFQGSTNFNNIDLIAPFSDSVTFKAMFEMPDGTYKPDDLDGYVFTPSLKISDNFNAWRLPITFPITQDYGIVNMQIRGMVSNSVVCTTSVKLPIQKGVPYASNFEELSDKDQLLQMIADLRALINGKVDKINETMGLAEDVTSSTVGIYFVYDEDLDTYIAKTLPQEYEADTDYYKITYTGKILNKSNELSLEYINEKTQQSTKLKVLEDKVTINNNKVVVEPDLTADNIVYDDTYTEMSVNDVQSALEKLKNDIDHSANVLDLGEITIPFTSWVQSGSEYIYNFSHQKLTSEVNHSVIVTPNNSTIDSLNTNDILIYPEIDIHTVNGVVVATIKADKQPNFNFVANFKIITNQVDGAVATINARQVSFTPAHGIISENVQSAIEEVKYNSDSAIADVEKGQYFTYIVDSDAKLADWADNVAGNDYSRVLIKSGTYSSSKGITLSETGTYAIVGETGNLINFTSQFGFRYSSTANLGPSRMDERYIFGVNIKVQNAEVVAGISNYINISNCKVGIIGAGDSSTVCGFKQCNRIKNCSVYGGVSLGSGALSGKAFDSCSEIENCYISYGTKSGTCYGFYRCSDIQSCTSDVSVLINDTCYAYAFYDCVLVSRCRAWAGASTAGYGYKNCTGISYCKRYDHECSTATFDTLTCSANMGDYDSNYQVANTPAGGFNDLT